MCAARTGWQPKGLCQQSSEEKGVVQPIKIMNHNIEGKVVVITNASSGLSEATAKVAPLKPPL